ncbi:MAG: Asp-tRNA(Asn)/Glu-tRNA(Gln) amidotransferase subunit GatB [Chloroflexi bacterium]|nr:Asp-tRNA(Asn)/Glu-tRNA(Gln) amidotransferase subunit GatB [Chloroflexota bacterium]
MDYETVIGLEVHAQLLTRSKIFCPCSADYAGAEPNTHVCPVCLGLPGVLPTINWQAMEYAVMTALALNCAIPEYTKFDRKNYPYPDLMKGYQISQYDAPLSRDGWITIPLNGQQKHIGITRVHMEEDTAKLLHRTPPKAGGETYSLVDVNRSGVPLMEIVSEPDMRSPEEARQYLIQLRDILLYLGVSTGNMEEGSFRCDANVSLRPVGTSQLLTKVEVKNMNSFRAVYRALAYEVERQRAVLERGGTIVQETRGWVDDKGITVSQRSKEFAHDYRYFPEPDLPPMVFSREWVEELRARLPEFPQARRQRFMTYYGLSSSEADVLTASRDMADYFEACLKALGVPTSKGKGHGDILPPLDASGQKRAKSVSNWLLGEFSRLLNATGQDISQAQVTPENLAQMLNLMEKGTISGKMAKEVFEEMFRSGRSAEEIVSGTAYTQISDAGEVESVVERVLAANSRAVEDFRQGKAQALTFLVGQVMKESKGRANPSLVNSLLRQKLEVQDEPSHG